MSVAVPNKSNRRARIIRLALIYLLALLCFVPFWGFLLFPPEMVLYFPLGAFMLPFGLGFASSPGSFTYYVLPALGHWLCIIVASVVIVVSSSRKLTGVLLWVLVVYLIFTIVGWYSQFFRMIT